MTSKGFTNTLKLASVFACGRMTVEMMEQNHLDEEKELIDFLVTAEDVYTAFEFVKLSQETYKSLKVGVSILLYFLSVPTYFSFPSPMRPAR